jgi:hypothetical protein
MESGSVLGNETENGMHPRPHSTSERVVNVVCLYARRKTK